MNTPLLWVGPVSTQHVRGTTRPGVELHVLGCLGDGPAPQCADHAARWKDASGRVLPGMLAHFKVAADAVPVLAAFSAGGQIVKRALLVPEDRVQVAAVYLADATYTTKWNKQGVEAGVDELLDGFVRAALDALLSGRWFVATASANPNKMYPSGAQTLAAIWAEIERRSGRTFEDATSDPMLAGLRPPVRAGRMGTVLLVDFGLVYKHAEHATTIAPVLLPRVLALLDDAPPNGPRSVPDAATSPDASPPLPDVGTAIRLVGVALLFALGAWILKRRGITA